MNKYKLQLSEGFEVVKGNRLQIEKLLTDDLLKLFSLYGYNQIKTPALEYSDVFCDDMQKPELYSLINRHGEILALSYDMTSSIARFISSSNSSYGPLRYSYYTDVFRYPRLYQGRSHEFSQVGLELVNTNAFESDVEIISLAFLASKMCKLKNFKIHLTSAKFLVDLFKFLNLDTFVSNQIFDAIEHKNFVLVKDLLAKNLNDYASIYDLIISGGDIAYLNKLIKDMPNNIELLYLKKLYDTLVKINVTNIYFDFAISSYARYYTGIVFQVYADGISESILDGGRYDELYKGFYKDYKACGFGINLSIISKYLDTLDKKIIDEKKYYLIYDEISTLQAYLDSIKLREQGFKVINLFELDYEKAKALASLDGAILRIYKDNTYREE